MSDNTELQRLMRLRRLGRQIAASLPAELDSEEAVQVHGYVRELLAGAPRHVRKPKASKAALRVELAAALANYHGPITLCPAGSPPGPNHGDEMVDEDEVDEVAMIGR
jgi:hypothetical protein